MDTILRNMTMKDVANIRIDVNQAVEILNKKDGILLDVRYPFETEKWGMKFAVEIPLNEIPDKKDLLPKDKIVLCACPHDFRSNIACQYLLTQGFNAKVLVGGLTALVDRLRGGAAKDLVL